MIIYRDFSLKEILYYKIGGRAKHVLKIENREDLLRAFDFIQKNRIKKILAIGLGSNLLVSDKFFDGVVLWFYNTSKNSIVQKDGNLIEVFASSILDDLIQFAFRKNLIGLEWAGGLPSTIGGAIRGNAGAFGGEIGRSVDRIEVFEIGTDGEFVQKICKASELEFGYRDSLIKRDKNLILVTAEFRLQKASKEDVEKAKETYFAKIAYRNKNHPSGLPSCGSVFKNITKKVDVQNILKKWHDIKELVDNKWYHKVSMGYVTNRLGFSGYRIGKAEVSRKHANYIVNVGGAKFTDVYAIIEKIKDKFYKTFDFFPELEVQIVN